MNIIKPSANIHSKPMKTSALETESLFGEFVEIIDHYNSWAFCKLETDDYCGWIQKKNLGNLRKPTHRVLTIRTSIYKKKDIKSNYIHYLSIGSLLSVKNFDENWAEIYLPENYTLKTAFVPSQHIVEIKHKVNDWVDVAEQFVGTPYKWGGRDSIGIDCSALLQLSYQSYGQNIPRNTKDQVNVDKKKITNLGKLKRGHVVFWEGHVGIMTDDIFCIHSNAFHMRTIIEPLKDINLRMGVKYKIIKILDFNN